MAAGACARQPHAASRQPRNPPPPPASLPHNAPPPQRPSLPCTWAIAAQPISSGSTAALVRRQAKGVSCTPGWRAMHAAWTARRRSWRFGLLRCATGTLVTTASAAAAAARAAAAPTCCQPTLLLLQVHLAYVLVQPNGGRKLSLAYVTLSAR